MGQPLSMAKKNRSKSRKLYSSQIFINGNNNLSHTFSIFDDESITDLININTANENELLEVCGIDFQLSKNIIKHRKAIGYYQKVEDLVIVPGMGAERLNKIRHYVCVSNKISMSDPSQSFDSLKSVDSRTATKKTNKLVNINVASIFDLQLVHGITQEIAAAIVYYRNKKGPFKELEDLRKIKCIDCIRLDNISRYLTVQNEEDISDPESEGQSYNLILNSTSSINASFSFSCKNGTSNKLLASTLVDIFELLSAYSPRPIVKELFRYSRNDKPAFRVSSWNLDYFSVEKASNLGVKEVICRTILENGWSILAVQNVEDEDALKVVCDELNEPKLQRVREWKTNGNCWKYNMMYNGSGTIGFIYDAVGAHGIAVISSEKGPPELNLLCDSLITNFKIGNTKVKILNLRVRDDFGIEILHDYLEKFMSTECYSLVCGNFGSLLGHAEFLTYSENLKLVLPINLPDRLHLSMNSPKYCSSNFIVNNRLQNHLTGLQGVQRNGLTHLAIPSGWTWGGPVSSFCPIWLEFFVNPNL